MLPLENSQFKEEIESFLARGGVITQYPAQENPIRISAKPRHLEEEDNDEIIENLVPFVFGGVLYKRNERSKRAY